MRKYSLWCGVLLLAVAPARAEPQKARLVQETWHAAYFEGARSGYVQTTVHEVEYGGRKYLRTVRKLDWAIKRYNKVVPVRMELATLETTRGKTVSLSMTQVLDRGRMVTTGQVVGDKLLVRTPNDPDGKKLPWKDGCLGLYRQDQIFKDRAVKAGDRFHFLSYEPGVMAPVTIRVTVKEPEEVGVLTARTDGDRTVVRRVRRKLLRVEQVADRIKVGDDSVQLPKQVAWLDEDRQPVRYRWEVPGLGQVTLYRTTREAALREGVAPELLPDLGLNSFITLNRAVERPHQAREIVYRITLKGDDDPATTFARDARQKVRNVKGNTFELVVRARREPAEVEEPGEARDEFLKSSFFLDSANKEVRATAARVAGREADPLDRARRIEKWVHENMEGSNAVGFARASQVLADLKGDCRQHAMLTAALCRAAGVPARTAIGLVYLEEGGRPLLGFHMWTEVWVRGQWFGLDATLGRGAVGPAHLKITDHSWRDIQTLAPLLPVLRVLGKTRVEVVSVK